MFSILIYSTDKNYLNKTIDSLFDTTPLSIISKVIVCDDSAEGYERQQVMVLTTNKVGKAKAWNNAASHCDSQHVMFIKDKTKFTAGWYIPILKILRENENVLVSPVVHTLDLNLWSIESNRWRRFGWRWDLNIYDRSYDGTNNSPSVSDNCIICSKSWFDTIGGFDGGMGLGGGADIEISLRSWLFGGAVIVADDSTIAVALEIDGNSSNTVNNLSRIVEMWLVGYSTYFYAARKISHTDVVIGRLDNLTKLQDKQVRSIESFLNSCQPELMGVYQLRGVSGGKSIAVVGPGPSLDYLNQVFIYKHDIIISVDYVGLLFDCDYVVAGSTDVISVLRSKYDDKDFVVPTALIDRLTGQSIPTSNILPLAIQFELDRFGLPLTVDPPFCDFSNLFLAAVQFALFLGPSYVTVFGFDNKIIRGMSHTSKVEYYNDGKLWDDNESTRRQFSIYESVLDRLSELAVKSNIPLLRFNFI